MEENKRWDKDKDKGSSLWVHELTTDTEESLVKNHSVDLLTSIYNDPLVKRTKEGQRRVEYSSPRLKGKRHDRKFLYKDISCRRESRFEWEVIFSKIKRFESRIDTLRWVTYTSIVNGETRTGTPLTSNRVYVWETEEDNTFIIYQGPETWSSEFRNRL